jgi:hypothetical protein
MSMQPTGTGAARSNASRLMQMRVWQVGVLASVAAAIATEVFALGAEAIDIPREVDGEEIPFGGFAMITLLWSAVGTVFAVALARWAKRPARTFVVTTVVLTLLSLVFPFTARDTDTATQVALALSHLVAAAIVIPALALRLAYVPASDRSIDG